MPCIAPWWSVVRIERLKVKAAFKIAKKVGAAALCPVLKLSWQRPGFQAILHVRNEGSLHVPASHFVLSVWSNGSILCSCCRLTLQVLHNAEQTVL
eukprot:scaffold140545_cov22-Tisochrysis_lutea.AAC.1